MSFNVGETVGPYRIIEQLGQGGMATVYKAYHASLDRYVAIKALHPAFNQDVNFESRFQREAQVVAKLEHPNIVPVYDYAEHEGRPYLVMKFIEGITLKARMDNGPLSSDEVTKITGAVGAALSYAHRQGVLHRDIKPSNVLMANDGQIYLADFGLARMAQSGTSTLSSDMIMGTPQYISPEQAMGKPDLDQRTDLYSFGVMLYEMVVGKVPYNADTPFSIIHDHIYSPLPLPRTVNPSVPEPVERVLLKALAKERDDRFEDASLLLKAFNEARKSDVNAEPSVEKGAKLVVEQSAPTKVASVPPVPAPPAIAAVEEMAQETMATQKSEKKRSPWMWVSITLILILVLGGFLVLRNRNNRLAARQQPDASAQQQPGGLSPDEPNPPADAPSPQDLPPQVAEAQRIVEEHPDDPEARLNLALVMWEANMRQQTAEVIPQIFDMVEPGNVDFYMHAGDEFAAREGWIPSAAMFFQAYRFLRENGDVPRDVSDRFHEAMYKAAELQEAGNVLQFESLTKLDQPISLIAKARHALYNGSVEDARVFLNQVKRLSPEMPEVIMLQAEFDKREGRALEARNAARELASNPSVPEWIRMFAEEFLKRTL